MTLTAHLDRLGLIGPNFSAVHAIWLDDDDMLRLADRGASAVHAPGSNLRFGSGLAQVRQMMDHGVNVALGDRRRQYIRPAQHVRGDAFRRLRLGRSFCRSHALARQGGRSSHGDAGSAKALGFEGRIGRIEPGYKADLRFPGP